MYIMYAGSPTSIPDSHTVYKVTPTGVFLPIYRYIDYGEVKIISIPAGGNGFHKYSIMFRNAQTVNIPSALGSERTTEKQQPDEKCS